MANEKQPSTSEIGDEVRTWVKAAHEMLTARAQVEADARESSARLLRRAAQARGGDGALLCHFLPMFPDDREFIRKIAKRACLPSISPDLQRDLDRLTTEVGKATDDLRKVTGFGRMLLFGGTRDKANLAAKFLPDYRRYFLASGLESDIAGVGPTEDPRLSSLRVSDVLADWVGFVRELPDQGRTASIELAPTFAKLPNAVAIIQRAVADEARLRKAALDAGNAVRIKETDRMLADMSVERLREASRDKIRAGVLAANGITSVKAVLASEHRLETIDGIGEASAQRIRAAARTLRQNAFDEMPMRIDTKNRTLEHTEFLRRLRVWDAVRRASASTTDRELCEGLAPVAAAIDKTVSHAIVVPTTSSTVEDFRAAVQTVAQAAWTISHAQGTAVLGDPWDDFLTRPADYFALLAELGFITEDDEKTHGDLPTEIIEAVREFELRSEYLSASLRGYQAFAARFALVQRKVIIGDEMGLGKTVEALAVLTHLRAKGDQHFLVVCPAAVVTNWVREVAAKSKLAPHRLHGLDRRWAANNWLRKGGVAVTTFETLRWLKANVVVPELGCVVVDEAHYIKNPAALRTQRTTQVLDSCERAVLLTGTPLENRLDEFRHLVGYVRSDLVLDAGEFSPKKFRRQVAPAYLRRNQKDVLDELPDLVEVYEPVRMSDEDEAAYRAAVGDRNFMAMRQAAMKHGMKSAKMQRLIDIVEEAEANGRRVLVFSHFLNVLDDIAHLLGKNAAGQVFGPLTGSVAASQRQIMVDQFSAAKKGAVLVAQILAGGVGLNMQAASVVVICEPQLKPTTEWQAIARAHRMGQLESVQVHRLVSDEGVDQRIQEILARKQELFESFARESETAASAPEAYDVTEAELARDIIAGERERLFGQGDRVDSEPVGGGAPVATSPVEFATPKAHQATEPIAPKTLVDSSTRVADHNQEYPVSPRAAPHTPALIAHLQPYPAFSEGLEPISQAPHDCIVANVVRIVGVEGPMTGWRIHQMYRKCASGRESRDEFSRLLNRAISAAERRQLILSENPLNRTGNKPRTFRLPSQSATVARELGPRSVDIVPLAEVGQYCRMALAGQPSMSDDALVASVARLLSPGQPPTADLRDAVVAARHLCLPADFSKISRAQSNPEYGSARSGALENGVCPTCFTIHAGECV